MQHLVQARVREILERNDTRIHHLVLKSEISVRLWATIRSHRESATTCASLVSVTSLAHHDEVTWWDDFRIHPLLCFQKKKRDHSFLKELKKSWQWKTLRMRQQFYRSKSLVINTDTLMSGSTVKNHISLWIVFGYNVTRISCSDRDSWLVIEFFSNFLSSTSMTSSGLEIDHPTFCSSSSTSSVTTVSDDSETKAREELSGIDFHPISVSSEHFGWKERGDPFPKSSKNPKSKINEDHEK